MRKLTFTSAALTLGLLGSFAFAQPPGVTMEMIMRSLPEEGAPLAIPGSYEVTAEGAYGSERYLVFRPTDLAAFPAKDTMPLMVWGNGGCNIDGSSYAGYLSTIASHGFLVMTTKAIAGEEKRQENMDDIHAAIAWADAENVRSGSPLKDKIDTSKIAVMGVSCGGFLSVGLGTDPRVGTIGVFNSGVSAPASGAPAGAFPSTDSLAKLHGPVLFINGAEVDFMMENSHANFEMVNHVPTFYGARDNAGHSATYSHPGGGEFANVASSWLRYVFKNDRAAALMFVGKDCELCTNPNWVTDSKGLK